MSELVLPEGWVSEKLDNLTIITLGQSPKGEFVSTEEIGLPFYQGKAEFGKLHPKPSKYCSEPKKLAEENDILLSVRAPVGAVNIADEKCVIGRGLASIRAIEHITDKKYLYYFFKYKEPWLSSQGTGTTFKAVTGQFVRDIDFILPSLFEQKEIVRLLDTHLTTVSQIQARLYAIPKLIERFRQSVLNDAVSGRLTENKDFQENTLESLTTKIGSGSTPRGGKSAYKESGISLVRSMNIYTNYIKYKDLAFIDEEQAEKLANVEIEPNDLLLNITGASIGRVNIVPDDLVGGRVNQHVSIIRCKSEVINPIYLKLYLASDHTQKWIMNENYGATRQALTKTQLQNFMIRYPSLVEQNLIVEKVKTLFAHADQIEKNVAAAKARVDNLTQSILHQAFTGKLTEEWRKQNPELITGDNSAEALLVKIEAEKKENKAKKKK